MYFLVGMSSITELALKLVITPQMSIFKNGVTVRIYKGSHQKKKLPNFGHCPNCSLNLYILNRLNLFPHLASIPYFLCSCTSPIVSVSGISRVFSISHIFPILQTFPILPIFTRGCSFITSYYFDPCYN